MKAILLKKSPFRFFYVFVLGILLTFQAQAIELPCSNIHEFVFSNDHESVHIQDGENYVSEDLPNGFYVEAVTGHVGSVKFTVTNLDTGQTYQIIENLEPYTYPAGGDAWNLGSGNFRVKAVVYKFNFALGSICDSETIEFSLDAEETCDAEAGTLTADASNVTLDANGTATISATANGDSNVPDGYSTVYVLTQGEGLVIVNAGAEPSFEVTEAGNYTIHTLVYDADTLDLGIVELGVTTGFNVNELLIQGGGMICASLDVAGAPVMVEAEAVCEVDAGTLYSSHPISCIDSNGVATLSAEVDNAPIIPDGYEQLYVLTRAFSLVILDVSGTPEFEVSHPGFYRIHSLVYDPNTLDLSIVELGVTTGFDVVSLLEQGGGEICASLDVHGAVNLVLPEWICGFFNSYYSAEMANEGNLIAGLMDTFGSYEALEESLSDQSLSIKTFPNPAVNELNLLADIVGDEIMIISLIDVTGRTINSIEIDGASINSYGMRINLTNYSSGTYLMRFKSNYRDVTKKLIIQK